MSKKQHQGIPVLSSHITSTVSVALVLLILGIVAITSIAVRNIGRDVREKVGFVVIMNDNATNEQINAMKQMWHKADYVSSVKFLSADDVLARWQQLMDDDENITETLGINPFYPEFEVTVKADYADIDEINRLTAPIASMAGVNEIKLHTEMVKSINTSLRSVAIILMSIAAALLLISLVLINNTVRLTIYSRRFTIHTMKLVGATAGFIRRPFVVSYMFNGIIAAFIAIAILCAAISYITSVDPDILQIFTWPEAICVFAGMIITGMVICTISATFAANKYLRTDYDSMFK